MNNKFILYLDLDGVLTTENYVSHIFNNTKLSDHFKYILTHYCFQQEAVNCLNKINEKFNYSIVLTSTRRFEFTLEQWQFLFSLNGIKPNIIGVTPVFSKYKNKTYWREHEIEKYHSVYKDTPFIIIDDDNFDLLTYKDKLIQVNDIEGLTLNNYNEIIQKLKVQGVK